MVGGSNGASIEILVTPEGSFPYYVVVQACITPTIIAAALIECGVSLFNIAVVALAILTRKSEVNAYLYLNFLIVFIFFSPTFIDH